MKKLSNIPLLTVLLLLLVSILLMVRNREYFAIPIADNEVLAQKNPQIIYGIGKKFKIVFLLIILFNIQIRTIMSLVMKNF